VEEEGSEGVVTPGRSEVSEDGEVKKKVKKGKDNKENRKSGGLLKGFFK